MAWDPKIDKDFESNEFYTMILNLQEMTLDIFLKLKKSIEHLSNLLPRDYFSTSFSTMQISSFPNLAILETPHFHWGCFQLSREEFRHDPRRKKPRGLAANNTRSRSALMASGMFIKCQPGTCFCKPTKTHQGFFSLYIWMFPKIGEKNTKSSICS